MITDCVRTFIEFVSQTRVRSARANNGTAAKRKKTDVTASADVLPAARVRGSLIGGAIGDALGAPVSHLSLTEIRRILGPRGIAGYAYDGRGRITADMQMAMFTAEGLLCAWVRGQSSNRHEVLRSIHQAYVRWTLTQDEQANLADERVLADGWLFRVPSMHGRRQRCCSLCLSAVMNATQFAVAPVIDDGKEGGGGLFARVVPVGLFARAFGDDEVVFDLAVEVAGLMTGHQASRLAAGYFAVVMAALVRGDALPAVLDTTSVLLERREGGEKISDAVAGARSMAARPDLCPEDLEMLGAGGGTTAVLAVGICCALAARTFSGGVLLATNHSGPSASTAAVTGNILGAIWGYDVIPPDWIMSLGLRHEITRLADDLDGAALNALDPAVLYDPYVGEQ